MAIKRAYKIAYKMKWHPDKNMDNVEEATEKKKSVVAAYECIGTAGARLKYGQALHAPSRLRLREARALGATSLRTLKRSKSHVKKTRPGTKYLNHVNRPESPTQTDSLRAAASCQTMQRRPPRSLRSLLRGQKSSRC